jgi:hypothetical protein
VRILEEGGACVSVMVSVVVSAAVPAPVALAAAASVCVCVCVFVFVFLSVCGEGFGVVGAPAVWLFRALLDGDGTRQGKKARQSSEASGLWKAFSCGVDVSRVRVYSRLPLSSKAQEVHYYWVLRSRVSVLTLRRAGTSGIAEHIVRACAVQSVHRPS